VLDTWLTGRRAKGKGGLIGNDAPPEPDPHESTIQRASALARAGKIREAAEGYREAAQGFLSSGRPIQAIAAAFEAAWLDPHSDFPADEAVKVARAIVSPVQRAAGQELIAELDSRAREALVWKLHPVSYGRDELVAREGDPSEACWFVAKGRLRATRMGRLGSPATVGLVGPGELVGESSLIAGLRRRATLVTLEPTDLLELRRADLEELCGAYPSLKDAFERLQRGRDDRRSRGDRRGGQAHIAA